MGFRYNNKKIVKPLLRAKSCKLRMNIHFLYRLMFLDMIYFGKTNIRDNI